jgi:hypothetical protein
MERNGDRGEREERAESKILHLIMNVQQKFDLYIELCSTDTHQILGPIAEV